VRDSRARLFAAATNSMISEDLLPEI